MARDLIGPALPPGFKEHATTEDEEADLSPGKLQQAPALVGRAGERGRVGAVSPEEQAVHKGVFGDLIVIKRTIQSPFAINMSQTVP
ncbi:hypothetical protein NN561_011465 [Cricetulus griseus]